MTNISINKLHEFRAHPYQVLDNEEMNSLIESVQQQGIMTPLIVRPLENTTDEYEIISGHRRFRAAQKAGLTEVPAFIRPVSRDEAAIMVVDSNLHREHILPSERAKAYQMKLEAIKHQGKKQELETSGQIVQKSKTSVEQVADDAGMNYKQVQRFIRLNNLIPEIMDMVDEKKIAFNPAVELSYLKPEEQREFLEAMDYAQTTPSVSQAQRIKKLSQQGQSSLEAMCEVMDEVKKPPDDKLVIKSDVLRKYFPKSYTPQQMEAVIMKLLEQWMKKRSREQER